MGEVDTGGEFLYSPRNFTQRKFVECDLMSVWVNFPVRQYGFRQFGKLVRSQLGTQRGFSWKIVYREELPRFPGCHIY